MSNLSLRISTKTVGFSPQKFASGVKAVLQTVPDETLPERLPKVFAALATFLLCQEQPQCTIFDNALGNVQFLPEAPRKFAKLYAKLYAELTTQNATFSGSSLELLARLMQFSECHPSSLPKTREVIAFVLARLQIVIEYFEKGETRPTFTDLTDAFRDLIDIKTCPANVALEFASVSNIPRAWERVCDDIQKYKDYKPVREMRDMWLKQATEIAELICNLIESGRVKPDYITCLGSRSSGEIQLLNSLTCFLNVLRKKLRRVCSILSNDPNATLEDVSVWEFVMSLPSGVRMLDIPVYTWAEKLCAVMYKRNKLLQLHNIVAKRVVHSLKEFLEMVSETEKQQKIPEDEVIPLTDLTRAEKLTKTTEDRDRFLKTLTALGIKSGDFFRSTGKGYATGVSAAVASIVPSGVSAAAASVSPPEKLLCVCRSQGVEVVTKHGMVYCFKPTICFEMGEGCSLCNDHEVTMSMCTCSHNEEPGRYQSLQTLDAFMMQRKFVFPQTYKFADMVIAKRRPRQNPLWTGGVLLLGKWLE